ncbi:ABC-type transporter, integral membrane subunit [Spirochaeta thermophila DSM 6578]|uniref:ABC-type transporter, integral membrane subunit n=1 Tax=Winmispira thermophila (strain ATCC 700085 / DSM 6578 / Z-1203) TaxID=869211 RepID=G0GFS1_WINT7|nr:sugar ABC transporter permease [Spirochaeta thermophila]AEJ61614.1 ABC-type transporter, integral membrane subunit [Spirochaeta thermophila DSM 6578]
MTSVTTRYPSRERRTRLRDTLEGYAFISPWLVGFFAFTFFPILASLYFAFTDYDLLSPPVFTGLSNFRALLRDDLFWKSLGVTFQYAFVSVPLRLVFALAVAMLLNMNLRFVGFYRAVYYIPSLIGGSVAVAVLWRRIFMKDGIVNMMLHSLGIHSDISWIGNPKTALLTLILLAAWQFGSSMLIFLAGLKQIPRSYYEAAHIDGANPFQRFIHITIPQLTPLIFFNLVMQLINGFTIFTQAYIVGGPSGDPMNSTLVYALQLYKKAFEFYQMGYASAMAWVLLLVIAIFTALIFKSSYLWVHYEAKEG